MIVAITGTAQPFNRFIEALSEYAREHPDCPVWVQYGRAALKPPLQGAAFVPRDELLRRLAGAKVVVTHGGCGSLIDALSLRHVPIVMPRLQRYREHVNDHQAELCEALAAEGRAVVVHDARALASAIEEAKLVSHARQSVSRRSVTLSELLRRCLETRVLHTTAARSRRVWTLLRVLTNDTLIRKYSPAKQ